MRRIETLATGLIFAEGPRWRDGALYFSDMHGRHVMRIPDGQPLEIVATLEDATSGLGWLPDGRLLAVAMESQKVMRVEADGRIVEHADLSAVASHNANDMVVAPDGTAYIGNFGFSLFPLGELRTTVLTRVSADGSVDAAADGLLFPNGIALSEDGKTLIVAESGNCCLTAFTVGSDGELTDRRVWASLGDGHAHAPDGICLDAEGAAWVALPHSHKFVRIREGGDILETIEVADFALACVLGGADRRTLFMAVSAELEPSDCISKPSASVLSTRVDVPGSGRP